MADSGPTCSPLGKGDAMGFEPGTKAVAPACLHEQEVPMKKLVRAQAGVKLERIKRMAGGRRKQTFYRLISGRNTSGRVIFDKNEAHRALHVKSPSTWRTRSSRV